MKLKLIEIAELYKLKDTLSNLIINYDSRRKLKRLYEAFEKEIKFILDEEQALIGEYAKKDEKGNTLIKDNFYIFENREKELEFKGKVKELHLVEIDVEYEKITLTTEQQGQLNISINQENLLKLILNLD